MSKGKQTTLQRLWRALFPVKRAAAKPVTVYCTECKQAFQGSKRSATCSKACKSARKKRLLLESIQKPQLPLG